MQRSLMCVPLQGCPKSERRLSCVRMQWVHWTNCTLSPLLAVSCGDAGLALFTLSGLREWTIGGGDVQLRNKGSIPIKARDFSLHWVLYSMGNSSKAAACKYVDSLSYKVEVKDANSYTSTPAYVFKARSSINNRVNFNGFYLNSWNDI
jgi:hypothetical protein